MKQTFPALPLALASLLLSTASARAADGDLLLRDLCTGYQYHVNDTNILAGLPSRASAYAIPQGGHVEIGIPDALKDRPGHPYTVAMKVKIPAASGKVCLLSLRSKSNPNDTDAMVYLDGTDRKVHIKQYSKSRDSAVSDYGLVTDRWMTLAFAFAEEFTQIFLDGDPLYGDTATLVDSYADCDKADTNFLIGEDDNGEDGLFYLADFRVYDGARVAADELQGPSGDFHQFYISSRADWELLASNFERGITHGVADPHYHLLANIGGITRSIGNDDYPFHGHFNGNSNTIDIAISGSDPGTALFPRVTDVEIYDLKVVGYVNSTTNYAAGLIGMCTGPTATSTVTVADCRIGVSVNVSGAGYAGGVIGHGGSNNDLFLWDVLYHGGVHNFSAHAGGLIGWCDTAHEMRIRRCLFNSRFDGSGKYHPILCRSEGVYLPYHTEPYEPHYTEPDENYYLYTAAPTEDAAYVDPNYQGVPVCEWGGPSEWTKLVTALRGFYFFDFYRSPIITLTPETGTLLLSDNDVLTGTGGPDTRVVVANRASVMLRDVSITNITADANHPWSGITCAGNATIVLDGDNVVKGGHPYAPGIYVPPDKVLTIQGNGTLNASSNGDGAGIGGGRGGDWSCGGIRIEGGTITATGGQFAAGIGGGYESACTSIAINSGVTRVVATHGNGCTNAIGAGASGSCGSLNVANGLLDVTEGATRTITNPSALLSYGTWATENGVSGAWNATDALGVHNVFRYVFNVPTGAFTNPPLLSISFDAEGRAVIHTPPPNPLATGFDISILATDDLNGTGATTNSLDASGTTTIDETGKPSRFFRLRAVER